MVHFSQKSRYKYYTDHWQLRSPAWLLVSLHRIPPHKHTAPAHSDNNTRMRRTLNLPRGMHPPSHTETSGVYNRNPLPTSEQLALAHVAVKTTVVARECGHAFRTHNRWLPTGKYTLRYVNLFFIAVELLYTVMCIATADLCCQCTKRQITSRKKTLFRRNWYHSTIIYGDMHICYFN